MVTVLDITKFPLFYAFFFILDNGRVSKLDEWMET